jgi:hypothetical protein
MASTETQTMESPAARATALDRRLLYLLPAVVLLADQLLKLVMIAWIGRDADTHRWEFAGRLVAFEYVENYGAAFGILPGRPHCRRRPRQPARPRPPGLRRRFHRHRHLAEIQPRGHNDLDRDRAPALVGHARTSAAAHRERGPAHG